jgi:transposase
MDAEVVLTDVDAPALASPELRMPFDPMVAFVEAFVDELDLDALGFVDARRPNKRQPHRARKLLKLFVFAALDGTVAMRAMARRCQWDLRMLYLCRNDPPQRSSFERFWRANHRAFAGVFGTLVQRARDAGLIGMDLHALDGSKIGAASSTQAALHRDGAKKSFPRSNAA